MSRNLAGLAVSRVIVVACAAAALSATLAGPARADDVPMFSYLGGDAMAPVSFSTPAASAVGSWRTRVVAAKPVETGSIVKAQRPALLPGPRVTGAGHSLSGVASYYWQGQMTATGERFDKRALTAAHKTLPFGTRVRVTRVDTGSSVVVRINDRGPFTPGRVIDLSERAAEDLKMTSAGTTSVKLEVLGQQ